MKEYLRRLHDRTWHVPHGQTILAVIKNFSLTEKVVFFVCVILFVSSSMTLLYRVSRAFMVEVPDYGGSFTEGIVGLPRFVNPLLASSDIDKDLTHLIYSGLVKVKADGTVVPDLAESYTISPDGLAYTVILRADAVFHDGVPVTADDVLFTIEKSQDDILKSPRKANFTGVRVEKQNDRTIVFTLSEAYSPFIYNLSLGILPKHIWSNATSEEFPFSQINLKPIGSGPYMIQSVSYTDSGLPSKYVLKSFTDYTLGRPYIDRIVIQSYSNEKSLLEAYKKGAIQSFYGIAKERIKDDAETRTIVGAMPRVFALFLNQNEAQVFLNKEVREALSVAINKKEIIDTILLGYGTPLSSPIPKPTIENITEAGDIEKAKNILLAKGWKQNSEGIFEKKDKKGTIPLSFSISTSDSPELKDTALLIQKQWQTMGAQVDIKIFETGDLNQNIIRPRKYDSLLFGTILGRDKDMYPFWHSSNRNDPGLNVALYTNLRVDKILEAIRKTNDPAEQQRLRTDFEKEITSDIPAIFTYSPYFIYNIPQKIQGSSIGEINQPGDRFSEIHTWYIETNNIWKIFNKQT